MQHLKTARRLLLVVAGVAAGSLVLAGPAGAVCRLTVASHDDGSAEATLDLDYNDDEARTYFNRPSAPNTFVTGMTVILSGSAYGGCGRYALYVNDLLDHTFDTCASGWQQQLITGRLADSTVKIEVKDDDGDWTTGIYFDVDTGHNGFSVMNANGSPQSGELMWRIGFVCV